MCGSTRFPKDQPWWCVGLRLFCSAVAPQDLSSNIALKLVTERPFANPEVAARHLLQLASVIEPVQDGRVRIEKINYPFLYPLKGTGAEFGAGMTCAVEKGELHESGTYVRLQTPAEDLLRQ
ncbi:hypothetical protein ABIB73_004016 [Bradyrhizobium sp. F1.4.3]|uniref:hypothetical protein n=1 Tax=Bradyrhizobium sp. F1.4.3 TaxID=3156356 RepID=UPI003394832F